ncbi:endoglucanase II, partial [Coprinopsis marcescibilis]
MRILEHLVTLALLATRVSTHTIFQELHVNGVSQETGVGIRYPSSNYPVEDVQSPDIICNTYTSKADVVIDVFAGDEVTAEYQERMFEKGPTAIASNHKGPILAYLAKVPDARQENVENLDWFKIYHDALGSDRFWATEKLNKNRGKVSFKIPKCIEPGQYLLRVEAIALHFAYEDKGAQFFLSCAQLQINGGGTIKPAAIAKFPGAYNSTDRGIKVWVSQDSLGPEDVNYRLPGPPVLDCNNLSSNVPWTPIFEPAPNLLIKRWGQCGGASYYGPKECAAPYTCVKQDNYVS